MNLLLQERLIYKSSHSFQSQILSNIEDENTLLLKKGRFRNGEGKIFRDILGVFLKIDMEIFEFVTRCEIWVF